MCFLPFFCILHISHIYFLSISNSASTISFYKITINSLSVSVVRNAPGESIMATSWISAASIYAVMSTKSVAAVGEVTSDFFDPDLCFRPSATARPYIFPHRFTSKTLPLAALRDSGSW